jgi:hypothetical protein
MNFVRHSNLRDGHAFLSPSSYHWLRYEEEKLERVFFTQMQAIRGTELHDLAQRCIKLGVKLPDGSQTLNAYVNDAIGFRMEPEVVLYYSDNCYGTADTCGFRNNLLRVHDLKTGTIPASMDQPRIYAALFCLEYRFRPFDIQIELRIYQNDQVVVEVADPDDIFHIMEKIKFFSKRIDELRSEAL